MHHLSDPENRSDLLDLLGHLPIGIYRVTPEGRFLEANAALAGILGYASAEELKNTNANQFYIENGYREGLLERIGTGPLPFDEFKLQDKDGRIIWVRDYPRIQRGPDGDIRCIDGALIDVTELKAAEEDLKRSEREYRRLFERAHDAVLIFTIPEETILDVNDSACRLYGFDRDEFVGMSLEAISKNVASGKQRIERLVEGEEERTFETSHFRKDGTEMRLEVNATLVTFMGQRAIMSINRDVTEKERRFRDLHRLALTDPLTGIANRALFEDHLALALAQAGHSELRLAVLFIDLDGFKEVNDGYGHAAGDETLRAIAGRLQRALRRGDTVARHGGDEFVAILTELSSADDANDIAQKLLSTIREPVESRMGQVRVSASIGIALCPDNGTTGEDLLAAADLAMYDAKMAGKDAVSRARDCPAR